MRKMIMTLVMAFALSLAGAGVAHASVPEWDKATTAVQVAPGVRFYPGKPIYDLPQTAAAAARRALNDCLSGTASGFCTWQGTDYTGGRWEWSDYYFTHTMVNYSLSFRSSTGINNRGNSWYNLTPNRTIRIFDADNCNNNPWHRDMTAGQHATSQDSDWGFKVSSIMDVSRASVYPC